MQKKINKTEEKMREKRPQNSKRLIAENTYKYHMKYFFLH